MSEVWQFYGSENGRQNLAPPIETRRIGLSPMPLSDLARTDVVTASPDTPTSELAHRMRDENVGSVIITNDNAPVGIVTDRDLTTRLVANGDEPDGRVARDVMSEDLCTASPEVGMYEAVREMSEHGVRRLPVCDDNGDLTGIITADDMIELLADEQQSLSRIIEHQRPSY